jgi:multiple antibiotic resistance protein
MIFPSEGGLMGDALEGEPFIVPLAIPFIAGPSTLAAVLLLQQAGPGRTLPLLVAITIAWLASAIILVSATSFYRLLKQRGLIAMERLMGMILVMIAVQMFMDGLAGSLGR